MITENKMRRLNLLLFVVILTGTTLAQEVKPDIKITSNTYHNWIMGWGVDITIKLVNAGDATAKDVSFKLNYTISNDTYTKEKSTKLVWGEDIIPTSESTRVFSIKLPKGFKVISSSISILSQ